MLNTGTVFALARWQEKNVQLEVTSINALVWKRNERKHEQKNIILAVNGNLEEAWRICCPKMNAKKNYGLGRGPYLGEL